MTKSFFYQIQSHFMKPSILLFTFSTLISQGAVIWAPAPNAMASAAWDEWLYAAASGTLGSGSQGPAQSVTGSLLGSSEFTTTVTAAYTFPGGLGTNPDTYYLHTGGAQWTGTASLLGSVSHIRVSYSLLGFGGAAAEDFGPGAMIAGATQIGGGSYASNDGLIEGRVFFRDFELAMPASRIEVTFGDAVDVNFMGSFRSVDGIQLEFFNAVPIPEPSSLLLSAMASLALLGRRRRKVS